MLFGKKKGRPEAVLAALATFIGGEVARDGHLLGTHKGRSVEVWLERIDPEPISSPSSGYSPTYVDVIRLRIAAEGGAVVHPFGGQPEPGRWPQLRVYPRAWCGSVQSIKPVP
jgi:hypothetical protein